MPEPPYALERTVVIHAKPETVFRFFTDSARWAFWWGAGSTIDATPGGRVYIRHPNGVETVGEVIELRPSERIVFTYGYATGNPIPPGDSRVTIHLAPDPAGTRLHLRHEFAESAHRDAHIRGWRFQLALFANAVANEVFATAAEAIDAWFATWAIGDDRSRQDSFAAIVTPNIAFQDRYSLLDGLADLTAHTGAAQHFMPGMRMQRKGAVRHCQGIVLADWVALDSDSKERAPGTNVFTLSSDGRISSVTGFQGS